MSRLLFLASVLFLSISSIAMAGSRNNLEIVAIVGDDAISSLDVNKRVNLAIASSGMKSSKEVKQKIYPQILQILIDESLYAQEARKLNITISEQDIKKATMGLEKANGIKYGTFKQFLQGKNIPVDPAMNQMKAQIIMGKIVNRKIRPNIVISNRELEEELEQISNSSGETEFSIAEIILPFENRREEKRMRSFAKKLHKEIKKGADFAVIAKEFSQNSTAKNGGKRDWTREKKLSDETLSNIRNLRNGEISGPFKSSGSYNIVRFDSKRVIISAPSGDDRVGVKQIFIPLDERTSLIEVDKISANIKRRSKSVKSCKDFTSFAKAVNSSVDTKIINLQIKDFNQEVANVIKKTKTGRLTSIIPSPTGLYMFMVCRRPKSGTLIVLKKKVKERITRRKMELQSQRYLRALRNNAFIEIRV